MKIYGFASLGLLEKVGGDKLRRYKRSFTDYLFFVTIIPIALPENCIWHYRDKIYNL